MLENALQNFNKITKDTIRRFNLCLRVLFAYLISIALI